MTREQTLIFGAVRAICDRRRQAKRVPVLALTLEINAELGGILTNDEINRHAAELAREHPDKMRFGQTINDSYCALPDGFGIPEPRKPETVKSK